MKSDYIKEMVIGWAAAFDTPRTIDGIQNPKLVIVANWLDENYETAATLKSLFKCVLENFVPTSTTPFPTIANIRKMWSDYNIISAPEPYEPHREIYGNTNHLALDNPEVQKHNTGYFHDGIKATHEEIHKDNLVLSADAMFKKYGFKQYQAYYHNCTIEQLDEIDRVNPAKYNKGA